MMNAESIVIKTPKKANIDKIYSIVSSIKGVNAGRLKTKAILSIIERVDVQGNPDRLIVMEFLEDAILINFSISNEPPSFRRWTVVRKIIPIIETIASEYLLKVSDLFPVLDKIVKEIDLEFGKDVKNYYVEIDRLKREASDLRKKLMIKKNENDKLSSQIFDLTNKLNEEKIKLGRYKTMSEEVLKSKIITWIREHHGEIDIVEFSKVFEVKEQVVEEKLNELIRKGNISPL